MKRALLFVPARVALAGALALTPLASCDCDLEPLQAVPGRVAGVLCDPLTGLPAPALSFTIATGDETITATTDEAGSFLVDGVPSGPATLDVNGRAMQVDVASGQTASVSDMACRNVPNAPGTGDIAGTICNRHTGGLVQAATVTVLLPDDSTMTTTTDNDGKFRVFNVPSGERLVSITAEGFSRSWMVVVTDGATTEIPSEGDCRTAEIDEGMLSGVFCDDASGGPLWGARVVVTDVNGERSVDMTDANGEFLLGPLPAGAAAVEIVRSPDVALDYTAIIVAGREARITNGGQCAPTTCVEAEIPSDGRTELVLVVDRSGSMNLGAPGYSGTRWEGMVASIESVTAALQARIAFGMALYPSLDSNECDAAAPYIEPAFDAAPQVSQLLNDFFSEPVGATPTREALDAVRAWHLEHPTDRKRGVLLATDGAPNCNGALDPLTCECSSGDDRCAQDGDAWLCLDNEGSVAAVEALHALGVDVYVIGIAGVEGFGWVMDEMAAAGGSTRHYVARDGEALRDAMVDVARRAGGCSIESDADLATVSELGVNIDGTEIDHDASRENGWDIVDANHIELYGDACEAFLTHGSASLNQCTLGDTP